MWNFDLKVHSDLSFFLPITFSRVMNRVLEVCVPGVLWLSNVVHLTVSRSSFILTLFQKKKTIYHSLVLKEADSKIEMRMFIRECSISTPVEERGRSRIRQREMPRGNIGPKTAADHMENSGG